MIKNRNFPSVPRGLVIAWVAFLLIAGFYIHYQIKEYYILGLFLTVSVVGLYGIYNPTGGSFLMGVLAAGVYLIVLDLVRVLSIVSIATNIPHGIFLIGGIVLIALDYGAYLIYTTQEGRFRPALVVFSWIGVVLSVGLNTILGGIPANIGLLILLLFSVICGFVYLQYYR